MSREWSSSPALQRTCDWLHSQPPPQAPSPMTDLSTQFAHNTLDNTPRRRLSMDGDSSESDVGAHTPDVKAVPVAFDIDALESPPLFRSISCPNGPPPKLFIPPADPALLSTEWAGSSASLSSSGTEILGGDPPIRLNLTLASPPRPRLSSDDSARTPLCNYSLPSPGPSPSYAGLSVTVDSNLSVFDTDEDMPVPAAVADSDPESRDSGFADSNGALDPTSDGQPRVDFAAPCGLPPRQHARSAPRPGISAPLAKNSSGLGSPFPEEDEGFGREEEAGCLGDFQSATMARLASCPIVTARPPRSNAVGTPPSGRRIRRSRPLPVRKSGLNLLQAGEPPSQIILGCRSPLTPLRGAENAQGNKLKRSRMPSANEDEASEEMDVMGHPILKRRKSFAVHAYSENKLCIPKKVAMMCRSASESLLSSSDMKAGESMNGDYSGPLQLPILSNPARVRDSIDAATLAAVLRGELAEGRRVVLVDCRYPFEYAAGRIRGAENVFEPRRVKERFFTPTPAQPNSSLYVYYCEFSQKRGPAMWKAVRKEDRLVHRENYPACTYPDQYLLEKGFKNFFALFPELCEGKYRRMLDAPQDTLTHFEKKSKSFSGDDTMTSTRARITNRLQPRASTSKLSSLCAPSQ